MLDPHGKTSHFIWRDPRHVLAWAYHPSHGEKFYLYEDRTDRVEVVAPGVMTENGHCTYLPGGRWVLNDTYPDRQRGAAPVLVRHPWRDEAPAGPLPLAPGVHRRVAVRHAPPVQPRRPGRGDRLAARGPGRQLYLIDVGGIVGAA